MTAHSGSSADPFTRNGHALHEAADLFEDESVDQTSIHDAVRETREEFLANIGRAADPVL